MSCEKITRKHRQVCIGDLSALVTLNDRALTGISTDTVDFNETFSDPTSAWAMIETVSGVTMFDSANVERVVSHRFYIRYDESVTAETWIEFENKYFDIIAVEDLEERHEFLCLQASVRGDKTVEANLV